MRKKYITPQSHKVFFKWDEKKVKAVLVPKATEHDFDYNLVYEMAKMDFERWYGPVPKPKPFSRGIKHGNRRHGTADKN